MPVRFFAEISHATIFAAVLLDQDVVVGELLLDAVGARIRLVDLVDRDDDRNAGSLARGRSLRRFAA